MYEDEQLLMYEAAPLELRRLLADGEWHSARKVRAAVCSVVKCNPKVVTDAMWEIGGEIRRYQRAGDSHWRLPAHAQPRPRKRFPSRQTKRAGK